MNVKKLLFLVSMLFSTILLIAQDQLQLAPVNPDFIEYRDGKKLKSKVFQTKDGNALGEIPSPVVHNFDNLRVLKSTTAIPTYYDLRTENGGNWLTSVKNQNPCGTCWAFATMGAIESYWLKQGQGVYDLSEQNLATCHGFEAAPCDGGGNSSMATAYISRGSGPKSESDIPYTITSNSDNSDCISDYNPVAYVAEARFLPGIGDAAYNADIVKQAIMDYGALHVNMYYDENAVGKYYNDVDYTYYYDGEETTNHAVLLVGWDDNKVVTGGTSASPTNPGAWIIRNSWGPNWGESGYFYISYEDTRTLTSITYYPSFNNYDTNAEIYSYDKLGELGGTGYSSGTGYGLIKNTTSQDQRIERIGTYINTANTVIDIEIYANFNGSSLSNYLGGLIEQTCVYPGYYTFNLATPVEISAGSDFYVRVKYNTGESYQVPIEMNIDDYADPTIETGKCWISSNGVSNWTALGADTDNDWDLCIKTYAVSLNDPCTPPATQASNFNVDAIGDDDVTISWTRGDGEAVLVLAKEGSVVDQDPYNSMLYSANSTFGSGDEIGSGNYVVYSGDGTSVNITGLSRGNEYHFAVYEYNTSDNCYLNPPLVGSVDIPCSVISSFPYTQDFSSGSLPDCWENTANDGGPVWEFNIPTGETTINSATASNGIAELSNSSVFGSINADLITSIFDFSGSEEVELNFEHWFNDGILSGSATVAYSVDNGSTWTMIQTWSADTENAAEFSHILTAEVAGESTVKFRWNCSSDYGGSWSIDDIEINTAPEHTVTFNVTDGINPIESANINIDGKNLSTDAAGEAFINLVNGEYSCLVTCVGYYESRGEVVVSGADITETVILNGIATSLSLEGESKLKIYPNPVDDELVIELETVEKFRVMIIGSSGKVLYNKELLSSKEKIDFSQFLSGIYLMKVQIGGKEYDKKIIKR